MKRQLEAQFTCFTSMTAPFVEIMFHGAVYKWGLQSCKHDGLSIFTMFQ